MVILLRIGLTPLAFALVTRAQARRGDWIGGRLIGLPLTTGPFLITVCLTASRATAAHAASGVTSGQMAVVGFCSAYAWLARRMSPVRATLCSLILALAAVFTLSLIAGTWQAASGVWLLIAASLILWPHSHHRNEQAPESVGGDGDGSGNEVSMLRRALISTAVVATMSTLVPVLGARPAGIISSAPILLSMILPSTHRRAGAHGAAALARGTIVSMAATVAFSAVLATSLPAMPVASALLLSAAVLCALLVATPVLDRALARLSPGQLVPGRAPAHP